MSERFKPMAFEDFFDGALCGALFVGPFVDGERWIAAAISLVACYLFYVAWTWLGWRLFFKTRKAQEAPDAD